MPFYRILGDWDEMDVGGHLEMYDEHSKAYQEVTVPIISSSEPSANAAHDYWFVRLAPGYPRELVQVLGSWVLTIRGENSKGTFE